MPSGRVARIPFSFFAPPRLSGERCPVFSSDLCVLDNRLPQQCFKPTR